MNEEYDILVAGGGMVGASLACALARLPLRIAVIEAVPPASDEQPSFDLRTTALSRTSRTILDTLGVWAEVAEDAAPIRRIHVSEQGCFGTAVIDAAEQSVDALGFVVENRRLGHALWARLKHAPDVDLLCPASAGGARVEADRVVAELASDSGPAEVSARLLVVADGARSSLRAALGIRAATRPYGQTAIVGTVAVAEPGDGQTAYERFTSQGPLAMLPAGDGRYVFVLTQKTALVDASLAMSDGEFRNLLQQRFGFRLGQFGRVGRRAAYPLELTRTRRIRAGRAVILGNAAHGLHPVAGQGYNLGLRDAATLAELIADDCRGQQADPGAPGLLQDYERWRRRDQRNVVAFTDGLVRLFDLPAPLLGPLRAAGLAVFDILPGAKTALARGAMGLGGRLTRLARGIDL